jgi:3-deoxy-7-phosphoheptulonate synthase
MIVKVKSKASKESVDRLLLHLKEAGFDIHPSIGQNTTLYGVIGDTAKYDANSLMAFECVESVVRIQSPYKQVSRSMQPENSIIDVSGVKFGGNEVVMIAGPCAIESRDQLDRIAAQVKTIGATMLRGGAFKPRTSPYSYQGMGEEGLQLLQEIGRKYNLPVVSELMDVSDLPLFEQYVDMIQVGARNMQNFALLKELGKSRKPILLKRGFSNTIEEWLMSAEYIIAGGNSNIVLCERGIRTFEKATRSTLDVSSVPVVKRASHLPVIVDPSHAAGQWDLVEPLALAGIAAGADGLIIEVHDDPERAMSDGAQSLKPDKFKSTMEKSRLIAKALNRSM